VKIQIKGARENNLQGINVEFTNGLTVVTGISGSGKSSLVFSTLYHEARRRFLNIFSRGTGPRLAPANVQEIIGVGPTVAIEQNILNRNPRSNLATASGLHPFFRLLYTHSSDFYTPIVQLYAPLLRQVRASHTTLLQWLIEEFGTDAIVVEVLESYSFLNIESHIANYSLQIILHRLRFLNQVSLGYLHCTRVVMTLSAGEAQRIRLASLLGSELTSLNVLIDEPTRGLHPTEVDGLLQALIKLRDENNTVIVVEHDPQLIRAADHIIDIGPGPGVNGGKIVVQGPPDQVIQTNTTTAQWLRGDRSFKLRETYRKPKGWLTLTGACENNLKGDLIELPLGVLVGVCGVSGSGKSTLLIDTIGRILVPKKHTTSVAYEPLDPGEYQKIEGVEALQRTLVIDQTRTQVSTPFNYFELKTPILSLYAKSDDAIALELDEKQLFQNCSICKGRGQIKIDMGFLPDVFTVCEICQGTGRIPEAWQVRLHGYTLPELFSLTLDQVYELFHNEEKIARPLKAAKEMGLGYLVLRQPSISLSGGECQRMKIAKELYKNQSKKNNKFVLYILDEPTIGQHLEDIARFIDILNRLVDEGHTVIIIEHHPNVLAACDWLIELGPEVGREGGYIIANGTPREVANGITPTAPYLRATLEGIK